MYNFVQKFHSGLAYLVLIAVAGAIIFALANYFRGREYHEGLQKSALVAFVLSHTQLLIGVILYFLSPLGLSNFSGEAMGDSMSRLYILEHPLTMIIAIVFITLGYTRSKKETESGTRYKKLLIFYALGLFLMLLRIPWSAWGSG